MSAAAVKFAASVRSALLASAILGGLRALFLKLAALVARSFAWRFFARPERFSALFFKSGAGGLLLAASAGYTRLLKRFGAFLDGAAPRSLTLWTAKWLGERFAPLFFLFVAAHALVPYESYRNPYTLLALLFFAASCSARVAFDAERSFSARRVDPALLVYFAAVAVSAVYSLFGAGAGAASSTTAALYLAAILFAFLVANAFSEPGDLLALIRAVALSALLMSLYGLWQFVQGVPIDPTLTDRNMGGASLAMGRVYSTLGNPNVLAGWLVMVIPFSVALVFIAKGFRGKLLWAAAAAPAAACLLLTQSRSGWIGLLVAAAVFAFLLDWRLLPLLLGAGVLALPFVPGFVYDRLLTLGRDTSSVSRFTIYAGAFRMALANWASGVGIGMEFFKRFINNYVYFPYETAPNHSHMLPLQIWLESGIVAAASFLWFVLRVAKKGVSQISAHKRGTLPMYNRPGNPQHAARLVLTACVSSMAGFMAMGCFEYVWFYPRCMNMFFIVAGICLCAVNQTQRR
jgi:O-antigen ligase